MGRYPHLPTHAHLVLRTGQCPLARGMRSLLTGYAGVFNRRYRRVGHLFQNRYKSIICDENAYLLSLVRYIHLNPVRAQRVKNMRELDDYMWSGHSVIIGKTKCPWMDTDYVLGQFGDTKKAARGAYRKFVEDGIRMGRVPELTGGGLIRSLGGWSQVISIRRKGERVESDERILGDSDFVSAILREVEERDIRQLKLRRSGMTLAKVIDEECENAVVSREELSAGSRRRKVTMVRELIAARRVEEIALSTAEIARHLGVNTSSITRAIERVEKQRQE
jgi:putative transposase